MKHACHAQSCGVMVPHNIFMCARHWRMVPRPLREAISEGWSMGGGSPYRVNCDEAIRIVATDESGRAVPGLTPGMKALTVWQPWASLIIIGAKPYEWRRWNFANRPGLAKLIGSRIVIHAGARKARPDEMRDVLERVADGESQLDPDKTCGLLQAALDGAGELIPTAAALGTVVLGDPRRAVEICAGITDSDRIDQHAYGWPMIDPQPFPAPIPAAGAQGFWNWS